MQQIQTVHGGVHKGPWYLIARFYRSSTWPSRTINTITLGDTCHIFAEDTSVQSKVTFEAVKRAALAEDPLAPVPTRPPHYRNTYLTLSPPSSLSIFFQQLGGLWSNKINAAQPDIEIQGGVYAIGDDIIIRVGKVSQRGELKGVVIEAELVPMATFDGDEPLFLRDLIFVMMPNNADVKLASLNEEQWSEVLSAINDTGGPTSTISLPGAEEKQKDGIFTYKGEEGLPGPNDWTGADRDKRSAFLLLRLFVTETAQRG
ncbi:hypothetical protein FRB99_002146 [Tulasnella sp. 403]|nr:hypothetical protein FRB99_002146 [Tulasnella sp. 403]